jgi:hypothetical protein
VRILTTDTYFPATSEGIKVIFRNAKMKEGENFGLLGISCSKGL